MAASTSLTPEQRTLRARAAAHVRWSQEDRNAGTAKARASFMARFEHEVDPDGLLPPAERALRAESAKSAYFTRLALSSSKARSRGRDDR